MLHAMIVEILIRTWWQEPSPMPVSRPVRDVTIGGAGGISLVLGNLLALRIMDWLSGRVGHAR